MSSRHRPRGRVADPARHSRRVAVLAWTLALLLPAGVGVALWTASGSGSGAAKARTALDLVVTSGAAVGDLYPGASGKVYLSVENPNPYAVTLTGGSVTPEIQSRRAERALAETKQRLKAGTAVEVARDVETLTALVPVAP
jgi:hypothetical protein